MTTLYMPDSRQCSSPVEASSKFAIFSFEFKKYFSRLKNQQLLAAGARRPARGWDLKAPEIENHKCILVHHRDPFTKLGPFKIELAYHSPLIMIIHELFTEEDTDYLVDWATPRLSRTRQIELEEDNGRRPKNEWMYRKTVISNQ